MTHRLDFVLFALYLAANIALGLWVARRKMGDARGYFLAGDRLPWYAIGGSIIAANISTEHFIGMIGIAYAVGFVVAQWEWGNWFTFSALIWIFLPYYIRGGLYTMPEFLERRYNSTCRYLFAVCSLVLWIVAQMAVVMLAGGKAMKGMFGMDETVTIVCLAVLAGSYTIYGGLISVAWTDFLQFVVMMLGGLIVTVIGLHRVGGLHELMLASPEKFKIIYPITDKEYPWLGVWTIFISVGVWYNCTNQFIVQRCLGARSEWDARMGVVFAGFMKILLPLLVVIPGIVAFKLFPGLKDKDQAFPSLVRELVPVGLSGIVMAGLASGMLSHISSVLNSCSTVFTMDLYKPFLGRADKSEQHLVRGRAAERASSILAVATRAGGLVQPSAARGVPADPECRGVGGGAHCGGVPAGRVVAADDGGGGDVRAAVRLSLHVVRRVLPVQARVVADAVRQLAEPHACGVADFDGVARGGFAVHPAPGPGAHPGHYLVVGSGEAAGVRARAEPGLPQPVAVVVHLHRHHGGLVCLCHLVPIRRTRSGSDRTFLMTVSYTPAHPSIAPR